MRHDPASGDSAQAASFARVSLGLTTALAIALTLRPLGDADVWFHLAAGRLMAVTGRWPLGNTFSFTAPDHPWIDLHWFFQLILYAVYRLGGENGCIALAVTLVLATVGLLYATAARLAPPLVVTLVLAVALILASPRFVPRPELLSFVLLASYLWLLERRPRGRLVYLLVPLQMLWANSQGIFAIGLVLIGCYWLGATLALLPLPGGWRAASSDSTTEWRHLTIALALSAAACLVNPYGLEGVRFPLLLLPRVTGGSVFSMRITEFLPPMISGFARPMVWLWVGFSAVVALSYLLNARHWHLGRLLAVAAFGILATRALRNVALFAWIAVPAVAANLGDLLARRKAATTSRATRRRGHAPSPSSRGPRLAEGAVIVGLALLLVAVITNHFAQFFGTKKEFGAGLSPSVPSAAVSFARDVGITGRPFNCLIVGGFLAWRLFPEQQVFVDGRLEAYPETHFETYFRTLDSPQTWPELAARYDFDYALLYHGGVDRYGLARYLAAGHGWQLVYHDETAALFLPLDERHREMRERAERAFALIRARRLEEPLPPAPGALRRLLAVPVEETKRQIAYGDFLRFLEQYPEAVRAYQRALVLVPDDPDVRLSLGGAYWFAGERDLAMREWREILRQNSGFELARRALAEAAKSGAQGGPPVRTP